MEPSDMDRLWGYLGLIRQNDPKLKNKDLKRAWFLSLEPYRYEDVRRAAADYFRTSKYFPDLYDITSRCPPPPGPDCRRKDQYRPGAAERKAAAELSAMMQDHYRRLHEAGLPTLSEAQSQGMTCDEWHRLTEGVEIRHISIEMTGD